MCQGELAQAAEHDGARTVAAALAPVLSAGNTARAAAQDVDLVEVDAALAVVAAVEPHREVTEVVAGYLARLDPDRSRRYAGRSPEGAHGRDAIDPGAHRGARRTPPASRLGGDRSTVLGGLPAGVPAARPAALPVARLPGRSTLTAV
ncbi:hypothetical protein [Geodermatophilus dictyosporus]|uniref:hypothetical protein n=1 Tax=Geodermatophilus dictyosporus TaxID=1523247 RepID=UPI0010AAF8D5|nr:hypothetical protein [Geodermatophilus dictyosporus]